MQRSILIAILLLISANEIASQFYCGDVQLTFGLVANGNESRHGEWPWLVSLHVKRQRGVDEFFCGASLINEWTLVTAAHCIREKGLKARHVSALLGRLDITDESEVGWTKRNISAIKMHENYAAKTSADSDIAIMILDEPVKFTKYIQPICLPKSYNYVQGNIEGTVVGYGNVNATSKHQKVPFQAKLTTIDPYRCSFTHRKAQTTVATNSFCAKSDLSVPCVGDSGGPFMVEDDDDVWTLLGVVSYAFNRRCNARDFAVFVDVPKFVDWIMSNSGFFTCKVGQTRVPWVKYCDGFSDCADGSDEKHCVSGEVKKDTYYSNLLTFYADWSTTIDDEDFGIASARDENVEGFYARSNDKIKFLPIGVDEKFLNLKEYEVRSCPVRKISSANFINLRKLEKLNLKHNEISSIEAGSFDDLTSLKLLRLNGNQISSLPENVFENLKELKEISLDDNQLKSLPAQLFKNNKKLVEIILSENQIEEIPSNFFAGLTEVEVLGFSYNQISNLPTNLLKDLTKLRDISLTNNKLKVLSKEIFQFNKKLEKIDLRLNQLEKIDAEMFDGMENLTFVDLSGNKCINKQFGEWLWHSTSSLNLMELKSEIKTKCN